MAKLILGKFEIAQQSGSAGSTDNGVKYAIQHTGRGTYSKQARGVCGSASAVVTMSVAGAAPTLSLKSNALDCAWDSTSASVTVSTNAEKFRVSTTGKTISLQSSDNYSVNQNVGTFANNLGLDSVHDCVVSLGFAHNTGAQSAAIPVLFEYWDASAWVTAGTFTVTQSSSDSDISITSDPSILTTFGATASSKTAAITCNKDYSIEKQGADTGWFTISRTTGTSGTSDLVISVTAQAVSAPLRSGTIVFKNPISGSTILTLGISQAAGEAYSVTITPASLSFTNAEVGTIKNVVVAANASWYIEEVIN